jgi:16S rRNA (cytidine1402-2'-O)-methyltransferase
MSGTLYVVATPIGNREDLTERARRVLTEVDFIVCEDTRHSALLLEPLGLRAERVSLPAFDEGARADRILERIAGGESAALVTDAGTPAISDPGEVLVRGARAQAIPVVPIPGASALLAALSGSGLPSGRFHFLGFLPRKGQARQEVLEEVAPLRATLVFYESPRRVAETLNDLARALGNRRTCVARELTKKHEEWVFGSLPELATRYADQEVLGEVVLLVEGRREEPRWDEARVREALAVGRRSGERLKTLAAEVARIAGWTAREVYALGLQLGKDQSQ